MLTQLWGMGQAELPGIGAERCNPGHTPQQLHTCPMCSNRHSQFTFQFTFELRLWPKFIVGSYQKPTTQSSRNSRIEKNSTSTARRRERKEKRGRNKRNGSKRQARLYSITLANFSKTKLLRNPTSFFPKQRHLLSTFYSLNFFFFFLPFTLGGGWGEGWGWSGEGSRKRNKGARTSAG